MHLNQRKMIAMTNLTVLFQTLQYVHGSLIIAVKTSVIKNISILKSWTTSTTECRVINMRASCANGLEFKSRPNIGPISAVYDDAVI